DVAQVLLALRFADADDAVPGKHLGAVQRAAKSQNQDECSLHGLGLPGLEQAAQDDLVNQRADTAALLFAACNQVAQCGTVAERNVAPGRIDGQLAREIEQKLVLVRQQKRFEIGDAAKLFTAGHFTAGIDGFAEFEADVDARIDAAALRRIALADAAVA